MNEKCSLFFLNNSLPLFKTLHLQTVPAELFSGGQGMTGYTGQLLGGSWSAIIPQATKQQKILVSFAAYMYKFYSLRIDTGKMFRIETL